MEIDVLGTKYTITRVDSGQDEYIGKMHYGGYCDGITKKIVILNLKSVPEWANDAMSSVRTEEKCTLRHELIHAFLNESGLKYNSGSPKSWATNEEMVDWIALQSPKIFKAFKEAKAI